MISLFFFSGNRRKSEKKKVSPPSKTTEDITSKETTVDSTLKVKLLNGGIKVWVIICSFLLTLVKGKIFGQKSFSSQKYDR